MTNGYGGVTEGQNTEFNLEPAIPDIDKGEEVKITKVPATWKDATPRSGHGMTNAASAFSTADTYP